MTDHGEPQTACGEVKQWSDYGGWGAIATPELPSDVFVHHAHLIDEQGFRTLTPGEPVEFAYTDMSPGTQDGYRYRAEWVRRV